MNIPCSITLGTRGFSHVRREFSVLAEGRSNAGHYKDLTETGNRARKVSGTQGTEMRKCSKTFVHDCSLSV